MSLAPTAVRRAYQEPPECRSRRRGTRPTFVHTPAEHRARLRRMWETQRALAERWGNLALAEELTARMQRLEEEPAWMGY